MANRESSPAMSSLAARLLNWTDPFHEDIIYKLIEAVVADPAGQGARDAIHNVFDPWIQSARQLAGSVLSQDETPGQGRKRKPVVTEPGQVAKLIAREVLPLAVEAQAAEAVQRILDDNLAGTHAYEIIAETEKANVETTETLIGMVAATVLAKLIQDEGGGRANVTFGPADMDQMIADYEMDAKRDGLLTVVHIKPREGNSLEQARERLMSQVEDAGGASPQAAPSPAKPHYFFNSQGTGRQGPMTKEAAQALVYKSVDPTATVENRMCGRANCPNSDMQGSCPSCASV